MRFTKDNQVVLGNPENAENPGISKNPENAENPTRNLENPAEIQDEEIQEK